MVIDKTLMELFSTVGDMPSSKISLSGFGSCVFWKSNWIKVLMLSEVAYHFRC